jgi:hypothetical protein
MRQPLALQEAQVARLVERDLPLSGEAQPAGGADAGDDCLRFIRTQAVRALAGQADQDRAIGRMALTRQSERAIKLGVDARDLPQQPALAQPLDKQAGGRHRAHGVRTGRAYADLEQIEDAGDHG